MSQLDFPIHLQSLGPLTSISEVDILASVAAEDSVEAEDSVGAAGEQMEVASRGMSGASSSWGLEEISPLLEQVSELSRDAWAKNTLTAYDG